MKLCKNEKCRKPLERRPGEYPYELKRRACCSRECVIETRKQQVALQYETIRERLAQGRFVMLAEVLPTQIAEWPAGIKFEDTRTVDFGNCRMRPETQTEGGASALSRL